MYRIHPALPAYLAARWRNEEAAGYDDLRAAATRALLSAYADLGGWLLQQIGSGDAGLAYTIIGLQRRTLGQLARLRPRYSSTGTRRKRSLSRLPATGRAAGLTAEATAWTDRVRLATEGINGAPPGLDSAAGALWVFFVAAQAQRQLNSGQPETAERTYRQILAMLQAQPASPQQQKRLGLTYHLLGRVAQDQGQLDEAADCYTQSLAILEKLGDRPEMAASYDQLGIVAVERGRLDEAPDWFARSLTVREELGDRPGMAASYQQLGTAAWTRGQLDEAVSWCGRSLAIDMELGNRPGMAASYHLLGMVAQARRRLDEAQDLYARSLAIREELGDRHGMATGYHQLGIVAHERGRLDEAADWFARSLTINEELGNRPGMVLTLGQLGRLAEERGQPQEALEWMIRCVALFSEFPHPAMGGAPDRLARLTAKLGTGTLEQRWQIVTGSPLPPVIRKYIESFRDRADSGERAQTALKEHDRTMPDDLCQAGRSAFFGGRWQDPCPNRAQHYIGSPADEPIALCDVHFREAYDANLVSEQNVGEKEYARRERQRLGGRSRRRWPFRRSLRIVSYLSPQGLITYYESAIR